VIAGRLPYAATPAFERDLALAAAGWALISASWFLLKALAEDRALHDAVAGLPTRRAVILHRLGNPHDNAAHPCVPSSLRGSGQHWHDGEARYRSNSHPRSAVEPFAAVT